MEAAPPSYEAATVTDVWQLIADHIPSRDLVSASLVNRHWHSIFSSRLWSNPTSIPVSSSDQRAALLDEFLRILPSASLSVRCASHTLHVPASWPKDVSTEVLDPRWLATVLGHLPQLQSLLVGRVAAFDHTALSHVSSVPPLNLRLLDVSNCPNATALGLTALLSRSCELVYLDMSGTTAAASSSVLSILAHMPRLRVLNMARAGLRNTDLEGLANSIGRRVQSLDLSGNRISWSGLRCLRDECAPSDQSLATDDWSAVQRFTRLEARVRELLVQGYRGQLSVERLTSYGITHLYLANNPLEESALSNVLEKWPAYVLELGTAPTSSRQANPSHEESQNDTPDGDCNTIISRFCLPLLDLRIAYEVLDIISLRLSKGPYISFSRLPKLERLSIYNVPAFSPTDECIDTLLALIKVCAKLHWKAASAVEKERDDHGRDYTLPPIRSPQEIFALETIVIEIQPSQQQPDTPQDATAEGAMPDESQILRSAAMDDYSFFDPGTMGQAELGPADNRSSTTADKDAIQRDNRLVVPWQTPPSPSQVQAPPRTRAVTDNIARLSAFRADRKAAHDHRLARGETGVEVDGYWPGVIQVVRDR